MNNTIPVAQYIIKAIFYDEAHWTRKSFIFIFTTKSRWTVVKERGFCDLNITA